MVELGICRRDWVCFVLGVVLAGGPGSRGVAAQGEAGGEEEKVRERGRRLGLSGFEKVQSERYLVLGNAGAAYLEAVGKLCEELAGDYLAKFVELGFAVERPAERMVVVALEGPEGYRKFIEVEAGVAVAGQYELDTNWLVIFDQRGGEGRGGVSERANTVALMHEATHQLTFNTGLLSRRGGVEVPLAISEGLATFGETRRPGSGGGEGVGTKNEGRIQDLALAVRAGKSWIEVEKLLADDDLFLKAETQQLAYAESWVMTECLLLDESRRARYREYLAVLGKAGGGRAAALEKLGDLAAIDREVKQRANRYARPFLQGR